MISQEIQIDDKILNRFAKILNNEKLAHAYLLVGPMYIGKSDTAIAIAKLINCEGIDVSQEVYCDKCSSCIKISNLNHPDLFIIDSPIGELIKIDEIRNLLDRVKLRPFEAKRKVFIIKNVENLTIESSNALLKTLEEPSKNTLLILTSSVPEKILDTIKSRCHTVKFYPSNQEELAKRLIKYYDETSSRANYLAYFSEGCFGKASVLRDRNLIEFRQEILNNYIINFDENFLKAILADKVKIKDFLDILLSFFRDCMLLKSGISDSRLVNIDARHVISDVAGKYDFDSLNGIYKKVAETYKMFSDNLNIKISFLIIREMLT